MYMPPRKKKEDNPQQPTITGSLINFYETIPKELLQKTENPNFNLHQFKLPFRACVSAPSGSGKSNFLVNLIHLFCNGTGTFQDIYIICRSADEPLYNFLKGKSDRIHILEGLHNIPNLDKMDKEDNHLVCFDDLVLAKDQSQIANFYIRCRKKNCSVIYLSQSYFDIPKMIRKNCSYMIFLKIGGLREIKTILRDFSLNCSSDQLVNMYNYATEQKMSPFIINIEESDDNKKFRKGFLEYLVPSMFDFSGSL